MFLQDKGFWIAVLATLAIMTITVWSFNEKARKSIQESTERRAKNRQSFNSLEKASRKLDIALEESEKTLKMMDEIKRDLDDIQSMLQSKRKESEEETRKTQNTRDN